MNKLKFFFKVINKKQHIINFYNRILGDIEINRRDKLYNNLLFLKSFGIEVKKYDYSKKVELTVGNISLSIITTCNLFFKYQLWNGVDYINCSSKELMKEIYYRFVYNKLFK